MHDLTVLPPMTKTRRRYLMVTLLAAIIAVDELARANLSIAVPSIKHDLGLSNLQVGMALSAFQFTYAFALFPVGLFVDRFGPRKVVLFAGMAWTLCAAATGGVTSLSALIVLRAGLGIAESPVFPSAIKVVNAWFPNREKALAIAIYEISAQVSYAFAPLLGAVLLVQFGWRRMFLAVALLSVIPTVLWWLKYRQPEDDQRLGAQEHALIVADHDPTLADAHPSLRSWGRLFRYPQSWALVVGSACSAVMSGFFIWLPTYLHLTRHLSLVKSGGSLALMGVAMGLGILGGAFLSDFLIRRGVAALDARRYVIVATTLAMGVAILSTAAVHSNSALLSLLALGSFAGGLSIPSAIAIVPAIAPNARLVASLNSLQNSGAQLGGALTPLVIGWLLDRGLNFTTILFVSGGFTIAGAALYGLVLRKPIRFAG